MRKINFSSSSSDNLTRSSALRKQLHEQNKFLPSNSYVNSNNTVQDYRFLPKPTTRVEDNNIYSNINQICYNSNWKQAVTGLLKSPVDGLSINSNLDLSNSTTEKSTEKSSKFVKTPYPYAYKADSYLRNEIHLSNHGNNLPLLPPSRISFQSETRHTSNRSLDSASKNNLGFSNYDLQKDTQACKKRNLQQVYKQKNEEFDEEEFHDAVSDDDNISGESINNPYKKPNIPPPQKKTYSQTPSTVAQTGFLGTQNNTPNKPTNTYGLPLSMIDDDYKPEQTPTYNFSVDKFQDTQKQTGILGLTQYSHPYNFPKASFLPPNTEANSNNVPSTVQRIRTPLRYRSSLLGALSNRTNSSCRILSAAEMKKIFCRSKRPIGSLKDFVYTIDLRNETSDEPTNNSDLPKTVVKESEIKQDVQDKSTKSVEDSRLEEGSKYNKEEIVSSKSEGVSLPILEVSPILLTNTKNSVLSEKLSEEKESVQNLVNTENLSTSPSDLLADSDQKPLIQTEDNKASTTNLVETNVEKKDNTQEVSEVASDITSKNKDSDASEEKKNEAVPWWLANVNKPNLVEVDNEGVFMSDEEDNETKDQEDKPAVSAAGLFSLPSTEGLNNNKTSNSLFSFANSSTVGTSGASNESSLFGTSLFQINRASENSTTSVEPNPEEKAPSLPIDNTQNNSISLNQSNNNNSSSNISLFGVTSKVVDGGITAFGDTEKLTSNEPVNAEKEIVDNNLKPKLSLFGEQAPDEEKKQAESFEKKTGIFGTDNQGSLFATTTKNNLFSQQGSSTNQLLGSSNISNSTQNSFNTKDIFSLTSSTETPIAVNNSEKREMSTSLFGSSDLKNKNSTSETSFTGSIGLGSLNSSSNLSFVNNNTTSQTNLQTGGLFDTKLLNFGGNSNPSITAASTSLFGGSNSSSNTLGQGNSLFTVSPNNSLIPGLNSNSSTIANTNVTSSTGINSIFGVQQIPISNTNPTQNTLNFDSNNGISGSSSSVNGPTTNTNVFSQTPSIFGSNNGQNPFVFGSNKPQDQTVNQTSGQNLGQSSSSNIFGSPQGIFNSTGKTETSIFGGMPSNPVSSPFDPNPQVSGQTSINTNIFGSNPSNLLGTSPLMGNSSNLNPFVGHSSNPSGGTSHRRRIARAKRSH